jgi:hypothetical protein
VSQNDPLQRRPKGSKTSGHLPWLEMFSAMVTLPRRIRPRDSEMAAGESFVAGPSPIPFASHPVVASHTALDHFVPPVIARDDEGREIAAAEAKGGEGAHYDNLL